MTAADKPVRAGRGNLVSDLTAGITTALVTIPDGMASAILAGVNPLNGLYARMVGTPIAALLAAHSIVVLMPYGSLRFAGASALDSQLPDPQQAAGATVITRLRGLNQAGSTLVSVLERYARKLHQAGALLPVDRP